jgi:hypothetical protein
MAARRGHADDSIYWDESKRRYVGAVSLGWSADGQRRIRRKVRGRTKTEVRDKLRELRSALDGGIRPSAQPDRPTTGVHQPASGSAQINLLLRTGGAVRLLTSRSGLAM